MKKLCIFFCLISFVPLNGMRLCCWQKKEQTEFPLKNIVIDHSQSSGETVSLGDAMRQQEVKIEEEKDVVDEELPSEWRKIERTEQPPSVCSSLCSIGKSLASICCLSTRDTARSACCWALCLSGSLCAFVLESGLIWTSAPKLLRDAERATLEHGIMDNFTRSNKTFPGNLTIAQCCNSTCWEL